MKKKIIGLFLLVGCQVTAQVSVFDCNVFTRNLSQAELNTDTLFYGTCVEIGGTPITLNNSNHTTIKASEQIQLKNGVKIGGFDNIGSAQFSIETRSDTDVTVMNYETLDAVLRYKKLELGVPITSGIENRIMSFINKTGEDSLWLNPFLEWDIDVEASFYHPESGWYEIIDGFYTREYEQNQNTSDWDDIGTDYPFRIRYAPPKNGLWRSQIAIKIKGQTVYSSGFFNFFVVESGDLGYIHVHENKKNLKRGGRMIFPIGENFSTPDANSDGIAWGGPDPEKYPFIDNVHYSSVDEYGNPIVQYYGHNLFSSQNTEKAANIVAWNKYHSALEQYLQTPDGGDSKYFRTIQAPYSSLIEFEEKGNYYKRLHYAHETDKILDLCEEYDALFQFNLLLHTPIMKYGNYGMWCWDWDHYGSDGELPITGDLHWMYNYPAYCYNDAPSYLENGVVYEGTKKPHEMFMDENDLAYHKQRTRYYIARYGYSTKIYSFELLSEPFHLGEHNRYGPGGTSSKKPFSNPNDGDHINVRNAVENYHKVISKYLKDSLSVNQLVGINMGTGNNLDIKSPKLKSIDFIGVNFYYSAPNALYVSDANYVYDKLVKDNWQLHGDFIPILFSEGGTDEDFLNCSNYATYPVDLMTLPFSGVAGFNAWHGWGNEYSHLRDITIRVQDHMNGDDVINTLSNTWGGWKQGRGKAEYKKRLRERYSVEHQHYTSSNKSTAIGYVKNRTYNIKTRGNIGTKCRNTSFNNVATESPRNTEWNDVKSNDRLRVNNLKTHTEYRIDWYSAFRESNYDYIKSDCIQTNKKKGNWGITLEYPELTVSHTGNNDLPVVWYVIYQQNCNSGMIQQNNLEKTEEIIDRAILLKENRENRNVLNVHPNPFQNYILIQSPEKDFLTLKSIEGKVIGTYSIDKGTTEISTAYLSNGIYTLTFTNQGQTFKLIRK